MPITSCREPEERSAILETSRKRKSHFENNEATNIGGEKMKSLPAKSVAVFAVTFGITVSFVLLHHQSPSPVKPDSMARSFVLWLHGLGDSGPANEPIKSLFTSPEFRNTKWSFPSAPSNPVTCNYGAVMPSWFDIHEIPVTADSPKEEGSVLKAVQDVHSMIDKEIVAGTNPNNVFVCGFSQGGALTLASVLLYPKTLGGGAVFSGWVPFNSSIFERVTGDARKTPILWSHGMADRTVLFEAGQAGPPLLEKAGVSCEFKAYPGLGHSISNEELRTLESWIKSRLQSSS
ncbi:UNVERIFIED_CONTAM: putative carboxylesterase SOBER1-like [Sesamum angustifolium]|uniref:Carboxylesterase SOBER1-like n=1 Tax=Sesamum angustifolium TaxID=2727405 RepID=A0AAW2PAY3_9LAMI